MTKLKSQTKLRNSTAQRAFGIDAAALSFLSLFVLSFGISGCSSIAKGWKSLISGEEEKPKVSRLSKARSSAYSSQKNSVPGVYRNYKRTTNKTLSRQAQLGSKTGSLWVMEGQGAYLFSQNIVRMIGDPISIQIEGDPRDQLRQKSEVISSLLKRLEARRARALAQAKSEDTKAKPAEAGAAKENLGPKGNQGNQQPDANKADDFSVKQVPTRVVERLVDGNYRVRGAQPFMIGNREYKVIVSGVVRAEDFNENGISATQLLDSNFDIVSSRGSELR